MKKTFVTFGQDHAHRVNGETFDKDCVAVIETEHQNDGRAVAFELFGPKFCMEYGEEYWNHETQMKWFPRGYIKAN